MSTEHPGSPDTWAIVSLLGHKTHSGRLSEEEKFGSKLGRLDIPMPDGSYRTVYFGGGSVYKIELVTEAVARHVATGMPDQPVSPWDFPKALPPAEPKSIHDVNEDERELCPVCCEYEDQCFCTEDVDEPPPAPAQATLNDACCGWCRNDPCTCKASDYF